MQTEALPVVNKFNLTEDPDSVWVQNLWFRLWLKFFKLGTGWFNYLFIFEYSLFPLFHMEIYVLFNLAKVLLLLIKKVLLFCFQFSENKQQIGIVLIITCLVALHIIHVFVRPFKTIMITLQFSNYVWLLKSDFFYLRNDHLWLYCELKFEY